MPASDQNAYSNELLTRYLLGDLPADQAEKLDELSVADEEFVWRLSGVENDLVDGFVRGELHGESLQKFQSFYLSSVRRRQKVEFAAGLLELEKRANTMVERTALAASRSWWRWVSPFRQWSFAAAALTLLLATGYLFTANLSLRRQANEAGLNRQNSSQHEQEMQQELDRQRAANAEPQSELDRARGTSTVMGQLNTVALLLPSPTRDLGPIETVPIHQGTDLLVLLLTLESDDFPKYRVTLKDPATRQEVWHSPDLGSSSAAGHKTVAVSLPAKLLQQKRYLAQLTGIRRDGRGVPMSDYPFSVLLR
jgi:hypothetical protein